MRSQGERSLKRSVQDLYQWKKFRDQTRNQKAILKHHQRTLEELQIRDVQIVNSKSSELAQKRNHVGESIESRLIREGKARQSRINKMIEIEDNKYHKQSTKKSKSQLFFLVIYIVNIWLA